MCLPETLTLIWSDIDSEEKKVLTISADGNVELFPFVLGLVKHAPFSLERKGWKLVAFRQRTDPSLVEARLHFRPSSLGFRFILLRKLLWAALH